MLEEADLVDTALSHPDWGDFWQQINNNPTDYQIRNVAGDWLIQHGAANLGAFMQLEVAKLTIFRDDEFYIKSDEAWVLLNRFGLAWAPPCIKCESVRLGMFIGEDGVAAQPRMGMIDFVEMSLYQWQFAGPLLVSDPLSCLTNGGRFFSNDRRGLSRRPPLLTQSRDIGGFDSVRWAVIEAIDRHYGLPRRNRASERHHSVEE